MLFRSKVNLSLLSPFLDDLQVLEVMQTLVDVVANLEQAPASVVQLFLLRHSPVWVTQLLEGLLHWPHTLFTLGKQKGLSWL